jgi:hypothetical protein
VPGYIGHTGCSNSHRGGEGRQPKPADPARPFRVLEARFDRQRIPRGGRRARCARLVRAGLRDDPVNLNLDPLHRSSSRTRRVGVPPSLCIAATTLARKASMLVSKVPRWQAQVATCAWFRACAWP